MDIGLGLSQILAMAKKKPHPTKPDTGTAPEIDPAPAPEPKPVPDAVIPGILDASRIVVLGSPVMEKAFGSPEVMPGIAAYAAEVGFTGELRVHRDGGKDLAQSRQALQTAKAEMRDSEGQNLYLLHTGAEAVAAMRPYPSGAETLAAQYRDLVEEAASTGDKVIPVPLTKILYGRDQAKYPGNPHDVVDGNPATEAFGTLPYNQEIFYPAVHGHASGWAPDHLASEELAARLSLTVNRASVMTGEAVYLKIEGLTDEEAALWGFLWEFDTSGEFQFLDGLPWHMRQKNRATGHHQTAAWDAPGTKTVKVRVVPPAWSGLKGTILTIDVDNRDPDVEFSGKTYIVDTTGTGTGAPTGTVVSTFEAAVNEVVGNGGRIRLKRGQTIPYGATTPPNFGDNLAGGILIDAWGDEPDPLPILDVSEYAFNLSKWTPAPFIVAKDVFFRGGYDVATGNGTRQIVFRMRENNKLTLNGCKFARVRTVFVGFNDNGNAPNFANGMLALYDCDVTAWEDYGIYTFKMASSLFRGTAIYQDPVTVNGYEQKKLGAPGNQPDHGPIRLANIGVVVLSQFRGFSCNGWSDAGNSTDGLALNPRAHQSIIRLGATSAEGCDTLINETWTESGGFGLQGGSANRVLGSGLIVVRDNYMLYTPNVCGIGFGHSGVWCHNNLIVIPDQLQEQSNPPGVFSFDEKAGAVTDTWHSKPIRVFNNTIAYMMSDANHATRVPTVAEIMTPTQNMQYVTGSVPQYIEMNNMLWMPNATPGGGSGPLTIDGIHSAGVFGPLPLYEGKRQEQADGSVWFNPDYASPTDGAILPLLSKDSALCGTADRSLVSALDFFGRMRGAAPTVGCVERNLCDALNPIVDPYELADRYPQLLGEAGSEGYGLSLGRYLLARVAAGALGLERGASRAGRSVLYNVAEGHPDEMAIGEINRIRSLTDYTGFPLLCGAKFQDGGFDPYIEVNVEPDFDTGVTYDGAFSHARIADLRLHHDAVINSGLSLSDGKIHRLHFGGLTPGDRVTVSCAGITTSTGIRRGDLVLKAGSETLTEVLDAASDAASNMAVFAPVTVPGTGRISLSITPQKGASNAFLSAVLLDFA